MSATPHGFMRSQFARPQQSATGAESYEQYAKRVRAYFRTPSALRAAREQTPTATYTRKKR